jgi:hypothetical protein
VEAIECKAGWKRCEFVIGKIDFNEVDVAFDKIKLFDASLAFGKDEHLHIFRFFYVL